MIERLRSRQGEIEAALRARIYAIGDPDKASDPAYPEGLRLALAVALDYGLAALEASEEHLPPVPVELIAQARLAARNGIGIDTVLRRYFGGHVLLGEFLAQEAVAADIPSAALKRLMHIQARALDRLLIAVSEEHAREGRPSPTSTERRQLRLVQSLLAGEPLDPGELRYSFEGSHLGLLAVGPWGRTIVEDLAAVSSHVLLSVRPEPDVVWAWLGGQPLPDPSELCDLAATGDSGQTAIAIGEPAEGIDGWRLTHRQAGAALPIAQRGPDRVVRYADVALLVSAMNDDVLAVTLKRLYLDPLDRLRNGGQTARQTLRAYFSADRNVSSAAAILGASRNTIGSRLRTVEGALGRPLSSCAAELECALRLERLGLQ